ncbi:MAG: radical SAM protein [bacterium]
MSIKVEYLHQKPDFSFVPRKEPHPQFLHELFVDPYAGCSFGCKYCWSLRQKKVDIVDSGYHGYVGIKTDIIYHLNKFLSNSDKQYTFLVGADIDPYQLIEEKYLLTKTVLETLLKHECPVTIITKSELILKDLELLQELCKKDLLTVLVSLSTMDEDASNIWEKNAPPPQKRLKIIEKLIIKDIPTGVALMPIIPYVNDSKEMLKNLFSEAENVGVELIIPSVLCLNRKKNKFYVERVMKLLGKSYVDAFPSYNELYQNSDFPNDEYCDTIAQRLKELAKKYKIQLQLTPSEESVPLNLRIDDNF